MAVMVVIVMAVVVNCNGSVVGSNNCNGSRSNGSNEQVFASTCESLAFP